jgi:thiosulfate/3-mercaptopyruvate sulfurtransferase
LLTEAQEVAKAEPGRLVVLDAREQRKFTESRVPGARWVDATAWSKAFGAGRDAAVWSKRIGELGIQADSTVVVYDETIKDAARVWWILRYWGVEDVRLLNGGWSAWKKAGHKIESGTAPAVAASKFDAKPHADRLSTKDDLLAALKQESLQVLDARSEGEFCGTAPLSNKRAGAIPGAKNLDWVALVDPQTQRFKPAAELRKLLDDAGIDVARPVATHCQGGGRSSVMAFALELMGGERVRNYYAGWSEWGNAADTPIEPGKPKKK